MHARTKVSLLVALAVAIGGHSLARSQQDQNPYRLKEPNQQKLCLDCHGDFEQTLKKRFVHTAVKDGQCSSCHNPHVASHGKLLSAETGQSCEACHGSVVPANAMSAHKIVADGQCSTCHDPHASDNPGILLARGNDLCLGCHADLGKAVAQARFKHHPVEQGCTTCHSPHASERSAGLLKDAVPSLCVGCHRPDTATFAARHMKYPVASASCTSCHDPHGSSQSALMLDNVHPPVATRMCAQCHEPPGSSTPFATKRIGYELCQGCHDEMVRTTLAQPRLHWPVAGADGCASCHNPHASKQANLLKTDTVALCRECHADTSRRIEGTAVKHAPVADGMCGACHSPHGASGVYLMDQPNIQLCGTCHDYQLHSSHPIGETAIDPRNANLRVDCLSCHNGHGTDAKYMLLAPTNVELCTPCHSKISR